MKKSMAIIGTGVAGMASAYFLNSEYEITLFECNDRVGGHSNTIDVQNTAFDTGFMVFNHQTYPYLKRLFEHLKVETQATNMSFSVQNCRTHLEWCGSGLSGLFSQKKNLLKPSFYKFILEIDRFNKLAPNLIQEKQQAELSIRDFAEKYHFSDQFLTDYLIPMSGAVWSSPYDKMLDFPALTLIRFFMNHGLLGLDTHFQWYTVKGGSREYVKKITAPYADKIKINEGVTSVETLGNSRVQVTTQKNKEYTFDKVIIAAHADEALGMLKRPTELQEEVLSCFKYQKNSAIVHSDTAVMPKIKKNWCAWNFRYENADDNRSSTIYYMNLLQHLDPRTPYFVSINNHTALNPNLVHKEMIYHHPLFDLAAIKAQEKLPELNQQGPVHFVGSYHRYGFHEDALDSAVRLSLFLTDKKDMEQLLCP